MQTRKCLSRKYVTFVTCTCKPIAVMHFLTTRFAEFKTIVFNKLALLSSDCLADMRQDMLTLQILRVIDKVWKEHDMDLR